MQVIPAINCVEPECVVEKVAAAKKFLPKDGWLHIDVADARFTFNKTWGNPEGFKLLKKKHPDIQFEIHLMVEEPERAIPDWLEAGAERVIVHLEALTKREGSIEVDPKRIEWVYAKCAEYGAEAMLAINPETPVEELLAAGGKFLEFQILAVHPGLAGQKFLPLMLEKVKFLRIKLPHAKIEVDGGVNEEIAKLVKDAGADIVTSASHIFESRDPKAAYETLKSL